MTGGVQEKTQRPQRLWTAEEFKRAGKLGVFGPEERLERIEGEILQKVSPQGSRHAVGVRLVEEALRPAFASGFDVRVQMPLVFGPHNRPEPDVSVVAGSIRQYAAARPVTAVLAVEVADTTLANRSHDQGRRLRGSGR